MLCLERTSEVKALLDDVSEDGTERLAYAYAMYSFSCSLVVLGDILGLLGPALHRESVQ